LGLTIFLQQRILGSLLLYCYLIIIIIIIAYLIKTHFSVDFKERFWDGREKRLRNHLARKEKKAFIKSA